MHKQAREQSVRNLQRVYTVVVSLAIVESLRRLLSGFGDTGTPPEIPAIAAVVSLLFTIVPFYHGANRYLDATYVTGERYAKPEALMLDFIALFLEGLAFFVLSILIENTSLFYTLLAVLFFFDAAWVGVTKLTSQSPTDRGPAYKTWAFVNIVAALLILLSIWSTLCQFTLWPTETVQAIAVTVIALIRTGIDYATVWSFYYPPPADVHYIMPVPRPAPAPSGEKPDADPQAPK